MRLAAGLLASVLVAGALAGRARAGAHPLETPAPRPPAEPGGAVPAPAGAEAPRPSWFALPVVFWMPETRVGFAAAAGLHLRVDGAQRASSLFAIGAYTLEHQYSADLAADVTLRGGTLLSGRLRAVHFPDAFYGIGPKTQTGSREPYTRRWAQGMFAAEVTAPSGRLRLGPRLDLRAEATGDLAPGGALASGRIEGAPGFTAIGIGGSAAWDTRDLPLFPTRGALVELWVLQYPEELGRHREFGVVSVEGRVFHPVPGGAILAAAAYAEQAVGHVPFTLLPKLGSTSYLRGWREGRYRDHLATAAQLELRVPLPDRFGVVVFASAGEVAPDAGALRLDALRVSGGAGLRFRLTPEGTNLRLDVAESAAGPEVYVLLLEAF